MSDQVPTVLYYLGRPIEELSKDELIECIKQLHSEFLYYRKLSGDYLEHLDIASYLRSRNENRS